MKDIEGLIPSHTLCRLLSLHGTMHPKYWDIHISPFTKPPTWPSEFGDLSTSMRTCQLASSNRMRPFVFEVTKPSIPGMSTIRSNVWGQGARKQPEIAVVPSSIRSCLCLWLNHGTSWFSFWLRPPTITPPMPLHILISLQKWDGLRTASFILQCWGFTRNYIQ